MIFLRSMENVFVTTNSSLNCYGVGIETSQNISKDFSDTDLYFILGRISENNSLFNYGFGPTYDNLNNRTFVPVFPNMEDFKSAEAVAVCGNNQQCLFDFFTSNGDTEFALQTMHNAEIYQTIIENTKPGNLFQKSFQIFEVIKNNAYNETNKEMRSDKNNSKI